MGFGPPPADVPTTFLELEDTPADYATHGKKVARVNVDATALEFATIMQLAGAKIFDGAVDSPPTGYLYPLGMIPYYSVDPIDKNLTRFFAILVGDYIYVGGGQDSGEAGQYTNHFWRYAMASKTWTRLANFPRPVYGRGNCSGHKGGVIYAFGHFGAGTENNRMWEYTIATDSWAEYAGPSGPLVSTGGVVIAACSDFLYMVFGNESLAIMALSKYDYTAHTWTDGLALPVSSELGGKIGDDLYILGKDSPYRTYKYNKGGDSWDDQAQNAPYRYTTDSKGYVEDADALWMTSYSPAGKVYRYTTAAGWVLQFNEIYSNHIWYMLIPSGSSSGYAAFGLAGGGEIIPERGTFHRYLDSGVWDLKSQALNAGDLITISANGVPVNVDIKGILQFTCKGLMTVQIIVAGTYDFTLDKDYSYKDVTIWRSTW